MPKRRATAPSDGGSDEDDSMLGLAEVKVRYLKRLPFLHAKDSFGDHDVSAGMVLLPTEDSAGVSLAALQESIMLRSGIYQNVDLPNTFMSMTKASAMQAKKQMQEGWAWDKEVVRDKGQRFAACKINRCQLGVELHNSWLRDLAKTCGKKVMLVNDFHHGSGEVSPGRFGYAR